MPGLIPESQFRSLALAATSLVRNGSQNFIDIVALHDAVADLGRFYGWHHLKCAIGQSSLRFDARNAAEDFVNIHWSASVSGDQIELSTHEYVSTIDHDLIHIPPVEIDRLKELTVMYSNSEGFDKDEIQELIGRTLNRWDNDYCHECYLMATNYLGFTSVAEFEQSLV